MKKNLVVLFASVLAGFTALTASAQHGPPSGPGFDGAMAKLFGDNTGFSATMEFHSTQGSGGEMVMPGKMSFLEGKSRFEMDLSKMQGGNMPPQAAAQMKSMGMGRMTTISRADKKLTYIIYPDMKSYVEMASQQPGSAAAATDYKSEVTKLGEETLDGHTCVKNKVVVTGPDGVAHESTVWNASDMKQFPLKIQMVADGTTSVMLFKDVKLAKPDAALFDPPTDFTKYDSMMSMMSTMMGRGQGAPHP